MYSGYFIFEYNSSYLKELRENSQGETARPGTLEHLCAGRLYKYYFIVIICIIIVVVVCFLFKKYVVIVFLLYVIMIIVVVTISSYNTSAPGGRPRCIRPSSRRWTASRTGD